MSRSDRPTGPGSSGGSTSAQGAATPEPTSLDSLPGGREQGSTRGDDRLRGPRLGVRGWLRFLWRQLTSMRTALVLLLIVALAAIPGSVFPQRTIDVSAVDEFISERPVVGGVLDALQMFDVYTSAWFSAIYLLLVISLVGCILPRTSQYRRTLTAPPPAVPRRPERLGTSVTLATQATPEEVESELRSLLRRRRYRLRASGGDARPGVREVAGETGYLREAGNLLFHYGVVAVILSLAAGYLVGWKGDRIVPIGESFANARSAYHTFSGGPLVDDTRMQPFVVTLDSMVARFEDRVGTGQLGAPREFRVDTTVRDEPGGAPRQETLAVNSPLHFRGAEVYLLGNGYAPVLTVRDAKGQILYRQATPFLPDDGNYRSTGAVKIPAATPAHLGFSGVFLPTAVVEGGDGSGGGGDTVEYRSGFPGLNDPLLVLSAYEGELFPSSEPQSVYRLDTRGMKPIPGASGAPLRLEMRPGDVVTLPGGRGSVEFSSIDRWAGISTRYDPVKGIALWSSVAMLAGLLASLVIPRRRVFARARRSGADGDGEPTPRQPSIPGWVSRNQEPRSVERGPQPAEPSSGGPTEVVLAGLARREDAGLAGMLRELADDLAERLPGTTIIDQTDSRTDRS
ncbi:cytochrome c biogenesis protein ResB [Mobilicoccus massiliensis]|uniref:cytochrome c biogenesis protein ResB n=1 Tax=Mobilicoccus massiliensis TaxID=1522310 RepID=UPI0006950013|nr:cytochrome c biogenesis protein ResB [Mobilicoccus massiliensis]